MNRDGRKLPRFFAKPNTARTCDHAEGPDADPCGKPAVVHIAWRWLGNGRLHVGFACEAHRSCVSGFEPLQFHDLGDVCGLPGALWSVPENRCLYPKGLPVLEDSRRAGSLAPA